MKTIEIFDKPMCCSTGVCGPQVDPVLPRFAADLEWLKTCGHRVERYNLAQQPHEFVRNSNVQHLVAVHGTKCLPVVVVDGQIVSQQIYPTREQLSQWCGGAVAFDLPMLNGNDAPQSSCCSTGCC